VNSAETTSSLLENASRWLHPVNHTLCLGRGVWWKPLIWRPIGAQDNNKELPPALERAVAQLFA
jgi:hypothetical protein